LLVVLIVGCKGKGKEKEQPVPPPPPPPPAPVVQVDAPPIEEKSAEVAAIVVDPKACKGASDVAGPDKTGMDFFAGVGGTVDIELTEAPVKIAPDSKLMNEKATPTAKIKDLAFNAYVTSEDLRPLTKAELKTVVFRGTLLRLKSMGPGVIVNAAPDCKQFTVADLIKAIEETERRTRGNTEWFDGIDVHHRYFEGINATDDGAWMIYWGS
jgi:hypothetical protein